MRLKITNLQTRLYLIAVIILLVGMCGAIIIYLTSENGSDNVSSYENSKRYMHDLELDGGKANVLADELVRWFAGLWHGKTLAFTVAFITSLLASVIFFIARNLPSNTKSDVRDENNRVGTH